MNYDFLGLIAGTLTTIAFVPQVVQTWKTKSGEGLNLGMLIIFNLGIIAWLSYGILEKDPPLIITNSVVIVLAITLLILKLKFRNK